MSCDFYALTHPGIKSLSPYIPGKSIEEVAFEQGLTDIIKLASNENPLGCSPKALQALQQLTKDQLSIYPTSINHPLRHKLAHMYEIDTNMLILSNGSDSLFCSLLTCFALHRNKHILTHDYAFISYRIQAQTLNVPVISTPMLPNWEVDIEAMIAACDERTAIIFLANPNNPTGLLITEQNIKMLLDHIPKTTLLVLDEAYYEYSHSMTPSHSIHLLSQHPNLVITRTFSKAYGLAGLRLGYAMANSQIIDILYRLQLPFAVNQAAMQASIAALDDQYFLNQTLQCVKEGIEQLKIGLDKLGVTYLPTAANFITIDCQTDATPIYLALQRVGIIVRPLHPYGLNNYLRVTIGTHQQNLRFLTELKQIRKNS